jgi:tetratricopeptide (TPR) repeat protein
MMGLLLPFEAVAGFALTPQEEVMCQSMVYNRRDPSDIGNWMHMHHYCDCIRFTNRAYSLLGNPNLMRESLEVAVGGCDYVLSHTQPDFYMRSEVHLQKGKALSLLRQEGKAINEFMEAIKGNPKLPQAYVELADIQARNKKPDEALKTVTEGLRHNPGTKSLQRRYTELGGKLPYPAQIEPPPVETRAAKVDETAAPIPVVSPDDSSAVTPATMTPAAEPVASPLIGAPKNPYCRFCPD